MRSTAASRPCSAMSAVIAARLSTTYSAVIRADQPDSHGLPFVAPSTVVTEMSRSPVIGWVSHLRPSSFVVARLGDVTLHPPEIGGASCRETVKRQEVPEHRRHREADQ